MKKSQRGAISAALLSVIGIIVFLVGLAIVGISTYVSYANAGNRIEQALKARKEQNKNIYATYGQKVLEIAQVPEMMRDDLVKVTAAAIEGRYGPDGSKATWQMIKEQNPQLDPSLYRKIQQVIESGRDEFKNGQQKQIDLVRNYETQLGNVWSGFWFRLAGYPKLDLKEFAIISTARADDVYRKGREDGPIKLR